jgi:hypothetical protein
MFLPLGGRNKAPDVRHLFQDPPARMASTARGHIMLNDWNLLSEGLQLMVSREALRNAVELVAEQADQLAREMEIGGLSDQGGPEALRLLAAVVRGARQDELAIAGHA